MTTSAAAKRYYREFGVFMTGYAVALVVSVTGLGALAASSPWRYPLGLLPVLPAVGLLVAYLRFVRGMDELQRRIQVEALAAAFAVTFLVTFTYGFLENAGLPMISAIWVAPVMIVSWGVASTAITRRYA